MASFNDWRIDAMCREIIKARPDADWLGEVAAKLKCSEDYIAQAIRRCGAERRKNDQR